MFDNGTKFRYFHGVLKEVYKIIDINYNIKDSDMEKLIKIIQKHLLMYNSKSSMIQIGCNYDSSAGTLDVYLSDYIRGRGLKKLFSDTIGIKTIMRDKLIDDLLSLDDMEMEDFEEDI